MAEVLLANTPIHELDPSLTKDILYTRLVHILANNAIDEIGILPFLPDKEQDQEQSSVASVPQYPFTVQEQGTKLGIPIYCWVPVLDSAYAELKSAIRPINSSDSTDQLWWKDQGATSCIMILCPDSFVAVNARKQLVLEGHLDANLEIKYLDMILTFPRNCKSSGAWHHRDHETVPLDPTIVEEQLRVCHQAAERYPKCYYAWTMRHWLVEQLGKHWWQASTGGSETVPDELLEPLELELDRMRSHMNRNISDHSTQQHLQQCMLQLGGRWVVQQTPVTGEKDMVLQWSREELARRRMRKRELEISRSPVQNVLQTKDRPRKGSYAWVVHLWATELERIRGLIESYPGHESLWYHLRFVYYGLRWLDSETSVPFGGRDVMATEVKPEFVSQATEDAYVQTIIWGHKTNASAEGDQIIALDTDSRELHLCKHYLSFVSHLDDVVVNVPEK
ncbi:Protein prenyltransferase alpha subunit repeat-containing protein 1 [Podila epicladia]|nr:Protein prenyltransferase alpha subunit repeat-containing protein 1 [Podila epicladia]